ncbi:MAG TPA: polyprenyl synthetase family protein [Actinotalea sp.]|nr:polyprenyl synthetase family protein [Actinotalea sp.]
MSTALVDVDSVRDGVDRRLAAHLAELRAELAPLDPACAQLVDALSGALTGGKRLRAAFCYWAWQAHGGARTRTDEPTAAAPAARDQVLRVGAALELFQAAALVHDDVMDASDTRRGRPAAHRAFEAMHRAHHWTGRADRFGESAAILLGDLALIAAEREFAQALEPIGGTVRRRTREAFDLMRTEVTAGQYLDVLAQSVPWGHDPAADEERTRAVIRAKSARYSVEHPLTLGAALAGADDDALAACREVGLPLGEAFQLRDDLLGVFGEPRTTGKPAGDDLREGKRTVLVIRALQHAAPQDAALLRAGLGRADLDDPGVAALQAALTRSGAPLEVERLIADLAGPALARLEASDLLEPGRTMLTRLGSAAVDRRA